MNRWLFHTLCNILATVYFFKGVHQWWLQHTTYNPHYPNPVYYFRKNSSGIEGIYIPLTSVSCVDSYIYLLGNIYCIRYFTAVNSSHTTSPPVQTYHTLISCSVDIPLFLTCINNTARNSGSIWKEPVPNGRTLFTSIRMSATSNLVSHTQQSITTSTNVLQGHKTVVLVCCTIERETDITWTWGTQVQNLCHLVITCICEIFAYTNDKIVLFLHFGVFMKLHAIKYLSVSKLHHFLIPRVSKNWVGETRLSEEEMHHPYFYWKDNN